jgi:tetratricopeptide (TPR) repeat protein
MELERRRKVSLNPFSPWRSTPESLNRTIVGRDHIIKDILDKTQRFCRGAPPKHCLLIGRRGLGKTHILALLYHYYENNCSITGFETISSHVLPVILLEEERYSLNSLAIFLIKIFIKFCEKAPGEARWIIPEHLESDEDIIEYCFGNLKEISRSEKKKIIILCDNLEEIFRQWQEKEYKILRAFLSDQQAVMLIGTSVKIFKEIISPKLPFYEFFETVPLPDLSDTQMLDLLEKRFIEDHMEEEFNRKEKHLKDKIAAIAKLTGGNPRLVVFLYDIVTKKNVFEIENATEELMESLNEYFRNRFSELGPQESTILDAFAEMDGPATPKEISKKTRIKENSTYAHIKNLKHAGFIDTVEYGKHKISKYDVTERLFRLWRQTATISGRRKFQILIRFLKLYYTPEEIKDDFQRSLRQLDTAFLNNKSEGVEKYIHYLSYLQYAADGSLKYEIFDKRTDFLLKIGDCEKVEEEVQVFKSEIEVEKADYDLKAIYKKLVKTHLQQGKYAEASKDFAKLLEYPISEEKEEYLEILDKIIEVRPNDDYAWYSKGRILVETDEYEEALSLIERAIELDAENDQYWKEKGLIIGNFGKHEEALKSFQKASELKPGQAKYYHLQAFALRKLNRFEDALPMIDKAIELDGNNSGYWYEKGRTLYNLRKNEEALEYFRKAIELEPEEPEYYRFQAIVLENLNRLDEALLMIEKAIKLFGKCGISWRIKGEILDNIGKYEEALKSFQKATELEPEQSKYYRLQAIALCNLNRIEEALLLIEKAIELNEKDASCWSEKGKIVGSLGRHEEALLAFQKASDLDPEKPEYYNFQTISLQDLNRLKEALEVIEKAIELCSKCGKCWGEKGKILGNTGRHEEALKAFQKASELGPEQAKYYRLQAVALSNLNRLKEALPLIEKAIELDENKDSYWEEKGLILADLGNHKGAFEAFQKASKLQPEQPEYYRLQAIALRNSNRLQEALSVIEKALELDEKKLSLWKEKAKILAKNGKYKEARQCFRESIELNPEDIDHKIRFLGFLIFDLKDIEEAGNYLKEIEKASYDQIIDNLIYLHYKSEYLILTSQFEGAIPLYEKRLKKDPDNWDVKLGYLINKACLGEFGDHMEGLAGKIANEKLVEYQIKEVTQFMFRIMETCLSKGDTQRSNGLYLTLLKLNDWHHIDEVQNSIALYIRHLVDLKNRDLFVQAVNSARELISDKNLLELLKAFIYAARYLQEGNKVILEEVFPEIREIIFDIIEKFESRED